MARQKQQTYEIDLLQEWRVRLKRSTSGEMVAAIEWCPLEVSQDGEGHSESDEIDHDANLRISLIRVLKRTTRVELKNICFELLGSIKSEDLLRKPKQTIVQEIISFYERRGTLNKLINYLYKNYLDYMHDFSDEM